MNILSLWIPDCPIEGESGDELTRLLLSEAPRVSIEGRGVVWVDLRGLPGEAVAGRIVQRLEAAGMGKVRGGLAAVPIAAEGAARGVEVGVSSTVSRPSPVSGSADGNRGGRDGEPKLTVVAPGTEAAFLADFPLRLLTSEDRLLAMLEGVSVRSCGDLTELSAEAAEVRFGSEGVRLWRLARGHDPRILFRPIPLERPHASIDFVDYTVRDATRLVFTLNALLDQVCGMLRERARRARTITLIFTLASGGEAREVLRTARSTADRAIWVRRLRAALEEIKLPDAITGVALEAGVLEPISSLQGDLFDRGFATATFVEEAVGRLLDLYRGLFTRQITSAHPLAERRTRWTDLTPEEAIETGSTQAGDAPALQLQLLNDPRPISVRTRTRRDHVLPLRYREGSEWLDLTAAGPDRISGGHEERQPYAREYYRCASGSGALLWIYRDAVEDRWYLHGWWD